MSVFSIFDAVFIGPLKLGFEIIFSIALRFTGHPGLAIIALSMIMNTLLLPLYKRADKIQEEARDVEEKLREGVEHIKKTFSGDERMMILQTYYRQNNYKPSQAINGSVSLLLEIPFFMAAYQFLSNLEIFNGASFGPIQNMGAPDGLIVIGGVAINLLPILMTAVNIASSAIYLKGFPLKTKIQLYAMAGFFLVFLYKSPACLVFYWTLNNVFSLVKNIFDKIKNRKQVLSIISSAAGLFLIYFALFIYTRRSIARTAFIILAGILLQAPLIVSIVFKNKTMKKKEYTPNKKFFTLCCIFITVLIGVLIPSTVLASAPQDFVFVKNFFNPLTYVNNTVLTAVGMFIVWLGVFYWLADNNIKVIFEKLLRVLSILMLINYMFFGTDLGEITDSLIYMWGFGFTGKEVLVNIAVMLLVALVMYFIASKYKDKTTIILLTAVVALTGMSIVNINTVNKSIDELESYMRDPDIMPYYNLSKDGENVLVIMLDRAIGEYIPYIMNEAPAIKEKFDGFTYYNNVISFGGHTNFAAPALLGGYEYTPVELNKRDDESLADKHNEALLALPVLFSENDYDVTILDPPYANYQWISDLSIYDEYEGINAFMSSGKFTDRSAITEQKKNIIERNFFCYSVMKTLPVILQPIVYSGGSYNYVEKATDIKYTTQKLKSAYTAEGINYYFQDGYNVLLNLHNITTISSEDKNNYVFILNDTTHEPALLQEPGYVQAEVVDNELYELENKDRFTIDGRTLRMEDVNQYIHYHANIAALRALGDYFDYLRANDVYDNTRIIIASDHGYDLGHLDVAKTVLDDVEYYFPLLLVKDFNETGFKVSDEFMTNADVPTLSVEGLIDNPVNPFTGNLIDSSSKYAHDQLIIRSREFQVDVNDGNTFMESTWATVKDNIWDDNNWKTSTTVEVLKEHKLPQ